MDPVANPVRSVLSRLASALNPAAGSRTSAQISPRSNVFTCPSAGTCRRSTGLLLDGGPANLCAHHLFRNSGLVRQSVGKLVTGGSVRNPGGNCQHPPQKLPPILVPAEVEVPRCPVQQVSRY